MALSLKDLRRRIKSINQTRKTTRAMEMVSAAKLRRAQQALMASRPYAAKLRELLESLAGDSSIREHALFLPREGKRKLIVLFTGDRGLCGAFNANLIRKAEDTMKASPQNDWRLVCVGKRGKEYFAKRQWPVLNYFTAGGAGTADPVLTREIADYLLDIYAKHEVDEIFLVNAHFISAANNRPEVQKFLNLSADEAAGGAVKKSANVDYIMEPSRAAVLDGLLPRYLASRVHLALSENMASEYSSRMIAMNNATKNCGEMRDKLSLQMNKARQGSITKELLEIVAGAEALKNG